MALQPSGTSKEEEMFLNGLFKKKDVVQKKDLEEKFYSTINSIQILG